MPRTAHNEDRLDLRCQAVVEICLLQFVLEVGHRAQALDHAICPNRAAEVHQKPREGTNLHPLIDPQLDNGLAQHLGALLEREVRPRAILGERRRNPYRHLGEHPARSGDDIEVS